MGERRHPVRALQGPLNQMGQVPLEPPNVKGWPGGRQWINTSTLFVRYNTAVWLTGGGGQTPARMARRGEGGNRERGRGGGGGGGANNVNFAVAKVGGDAVEVVNYWVNRLIQRPIDDEKKQVLIDTLNDRPNDEEAVKKMVQLIVSMPEYQLC